MKVHSSVTDSSQSWEHGAYYTACRQLNRLESVLSKRFGCSKTLPGCWVAFYLLQTTVLVSESSLHFLFSPRTVYFEAQLSLSEWDSELLWFTLAGQAYWNWSHSGTSWSYLELYTFLLKKIPCRVQCVNLRGNCYTTTSSDTSHSQIKFLCLLDIEFIHHSSRH